MAEKLCTLRKKGGGGGRYTETSLWTNASPTSSFAAQVVTLSDSIDNYKYIAIKYKFDTSSNVEGSVIFLVSDIKKSVQGVDTIVPCIGASPQGVANYARRVFYTSNTKIRIEIATAMNKTGTSTAYVIPLEILGLNELDHGTKYTTNASEIAFKSVSANTIPTFTTVAEAKAIWLTINYASAYRTLQITNVNPTTGEINNDSLYKIDTNSLGNIEPLTGNKFIVTSNSVTMQNAPSTAATQQSLIYTY